MSRSLLLAFAVVGSAAASAQTVNTQVSGITLTNGLTTITDSSALTPVNLSVGLGYLTDNDTSTLVWNLGLRDGTGSIQGAFGGAISNSATGIYIVGAGIANGTFSMQLQLLSGLTGSRTYGDSNFVATSQSFFFTALQNDAGWDEAGTLITSASYNEYFNYSYLYVPLSDFGVTNAQVVGIKLSNFTSLNLDVGYIGLGYGGNYGGGSPVPEPSTYGLALGGLALVGAVIRRRKISK